MGRRILTDAQRGWGVNRISKHFGASGTKISAGAINWQCLVHGADTTRRLRGKHTQASSTFQRGNHVVRPYSREDDALLLALEKQGLTYCAIARRMGRKPNSIRGRLLTLARRDARTEDARRLIAVERSRKKVLLDGNKHCAVAEVRQ